MEDIISVIKHNERTFQDFHQWIFNKLGKNKQNFRNFVKYPNTIKIPYILEYLEHRKVPLVEALVFYNTAIIADRDLTYEELCFVLIKAEFNRIEKKKTINYIPF